MNTNSKPPKRPETPPVANLSSPARPPAVGPDATGSPPRPKTPLFAGPAPPRPAVKPAPAPAPAKPARAVPLPPARPLATEPIPARPSAPANNKPTGWWARFTKKIGFRGKANITTNTKKNNNKRTWFQKTRSAFVRIPINRALDNIYKLANKLDGSSSDKNIIAELETVIEALRTKLNTSSGSNNNIAWGNGIHNDLGTFSRVLELYKTYYVTIPGYILNLRTLQADLKNVEISGIKIQTLKQLANKLDGSSSDKDIITELETVIAGIHTRLNTLSSNKNRAWGNGIINDLGTFSRVLDKYKTYYVTIPGYTLNLRTLQAYLNNVEISGIKTPKLKQLAVTLKYAVTEAVSTVCKNQPEDICTRVNSRLTNPVVIANIPPPSPPFSNPMFARSSSQKSSVSRSHSSANNPAPEPASNSKSRMINNILNNAPRPIKLGLTNNTTSRLRARLMGAKNNNKPLLTLEPETKAELLERLNNYSSNTNLTKTANAKLNVRLLIDGIPTKTRGPPVPARRRTSMIPNAFRNP